MPLDEKLLPSLAGLWKDEIKRRIKKLGATGDDCSPFSLAELVSMSAEPRNAANGGWVHENQYRQQMAAIATNERLKSDGQSVSFHHFVERSPFEATIPSALDSVQDLFPGSLHVKQSENFTSQLAPGEEPRPDILIDESRIFSLGLEDVADESDTSISDSLSQIMYDGQTQSSNDPNPEPSVGKEFDAPLVGKFDGKLSHIPPLCERPTTLLQLERIGIRKSSKPINSQEDMFEIDDEFTSDIHPHSETVKRSTPQVSGPGSTKRIKLSHNDNGSVARLLFPLGRSVGLSGNLSTDDHPLEDQSMKLDDGLTCMIHPSCRHIRTIFSIT